MKKATLKLDKDFSIDKVDQRIFSTFIESIHKIVYGCIYNPDHPTADEQGFRKDVLELMRELKSTAIRYPGGNFVSDYHWMDGIGPKELRPKRFVKAWKMIENNHMGIDEYTDWVKKAGSEPMLAVNLGTGTPEEASYEVEYTNMKEGTYFSDLRKKYGHEEPHNIKLWCLGNEMDGTWQMGEKTAMEYGRIAYEAAKQMKIVDPDIEFVACGSCANDKTHPTFPEWDRVVLEQCYENVDYLSLHRYYNYDPESVKGTVFPADFTPEDLPYIARDLTGFINTVCAAADYVKGLKYSNKTINICFDEWGIMSSQTAKAEGLDWSERSLPEPGGRPEGTNLIDACLFGSILISFINRCDRVKIACQSIVIGSVIGVDPEGGVYKQTTFYPFQHAATYAKGVALRTSLISPMKKTDNYGEQPYIQTAGVYDEETGSLTVFAVNLDLRETVEFNCIPQFDKVELLQHIQLHEDQPLAMNTIKNPTRVVPKEIEITDKVTLPPLSWNVLRYKVK
ncbi:alpha-N-arabinofuranosidase [Lachnospiraceae bacterium MD1]|uniref:non-reducing end alpha-L-arabinofuranosidase n=1 Tax=Variimorphobacter saccharofermentans TaxID=2755051 RepID=A0A839K5A8_9FIRM|nr:alpha-L-arabinofuranosidase C-terminal domain-containing protein [Variimorphobacter saccharofermentans]MBB2183851.1 alpha-N-arabinofuranosidase [Variimorphobacter saccharofermentans]